MSAWSVIIERTPERMSRARSGDVRRSARALVLEPPLLLIDEPGHGLDPHAAAELDETLRALHERYRCGILICSQEVRYAFHWPSAVSVLATVASSNKAISTHLRNSRHEAVRRFVDRRGAA